MEAAGEKRAIQPGVDGPGFGENARAMAWNGDEELKGGNGDQPAEHDSNPRADVADDQLQRRGNAPGDADLSEDAGVAGFDGFVGKRAVVNDSQQDKQAGTPQDLFPQLLLRIPAVDPGVHRKRDGDA